MKVLVSMLVALAAVSAQAKTISTRVLPADAQNVQIASLRLSEAPNGKKVEVTVFDNETQQWVTELHNAVEPVYAITVSYESERDAHYESRFDQDVRTNISEKTFYVSLASLSEYAGVIKARPTKASTALANRLFETKVTEKTSVETRKINRCYDNNDNLVECTGPAQYVSETVTRKYLYLNEKAQ